MWLRILFLIYECSGNVRTALFQSYLQFMSHRARICNNSDKTMSKPCLLCYLSRFSYDIFFISCCERHQLVVYVSTWWAANNTQNTSFELKTFAWKNQWGSKNKTSSRKKYLSNEGTHKCQREIDGPIATIKLRPHNLETAYFRLVCFITPSLFVTHIEGTFETILFVTSFHPVIFDKVLGRGDLEPSLI